MRNQIIILFLCLSFAASCFAAAEEKEPNYFGLRPGTLPQIKARLRTNDSSLQPALKKLIEDADKALRVSPPSVMQKTKVPPSGDPHDYMSTAPYFWPDPASSNGLPYIRHDGKVNPESRGPASDHGRIGQMAGTVETLALACYFTDNRAYADHAARCLRTWFLDPSTRMNPHLNFAQGIPGVNEGRGTGIIEGRAIAEAADAAQLLAGCSAWTQQDQAALREWLGVYLDWLLTSKNGRDEANARNNHGTLYDVQAMRLALVLGKRGLAKQMAETAKQKRIAAQIEPDGRQPLELERTASFGYSRFNLEALFALATLAEHVDVDLWHYETRDGRSVRKALDYMLPYVDLPAKPWPYQQIKPFDPADFAPLLRQAAVVYREPKYEKVLLKFSDVPAKRLLLLYPNSPAR